jgi:hypothetical protein
VPPAPASLLIRRGIEGAAYRGLRMPRIGVDAPVVPVQSSNAAPRLIVILALARAQPTSRGVPSTGSYFQSCGAE